MLVHFPIALILVGFLFDLVSLFIKKEPCLSRAGFWLLALGMVATIFTYGTGYFLTDPEVGGIIREKHELFATWALVCIVLTTLFRIVAIYLEKNTAGIKFTLLGLYLACAVLISITGYLGGTIVWGE
jgi:uncharacterized membrane protein